MIRYWLRGPNEFETYMFLIGMIIVYLFALVVFVVLLGGLGFLMWLILTIISIYGIKWFLKIYR